MSESADGNDRIDHAVDACANIPAPAIEKRAQSWMTSRSLRRRPQPTKVSAERARQIVEQHRAGLGPKALAEQFGLHRSTVIRVLRRSGIAARKPLLDDGRIGEVRRFYGAGRSIEATARHFGVARGTILRFIEKHDIPRRGTHQWRATARFR